MNNILRAVVAVPAILFMVIGLGWLTTPADVAAQLGMPLLDGLGRSTQIGDMAAFFFGGGAMMLLGVVTRNRTWLLAPALLLGLTAVFRLVAWQGHDAAFAGAQIAVEVIVSALLVFAASRVNSGAR
jgi:hypothetical protein